MDLNSYNSHPSDNMEEHHDAAPAEFPVDNSERIQTTGSGLSGGSGVFSGLSDLEGEPLANQHSTDSQSVPTVPTGMVEEARSMEETGSLFSAGGTEPSATSPTPHYAVAAVSPVVTSPGRTMSPFAEGAAAIPLLPSASSGEPSPMSTGSFSPSAQAQQPVSPSRNSRRTSDAAAKARIGRTGTTTPGAVAVQPSQPMATPQPPVMSQAEADAMAKARGARPSQRQSHEQPTVTPGAVAVQPSQPLVSQPPAMSQAEADAMAKARGARPSQRQSHQQPQAVITPGAVAVQPSQPVPPTTQSSVLSQSEEDAMIKARAARPSRRQGQQQPTEPSSPRAQPMTQAQLDAEAKARARGSASVSSGATVVSHQTEETGAMDEMARRREERAQARAERLGVSTSVGAVSVASSQSTRESRKMERASGHGTPPSTGPQANTASFANMSEDERQRRYDAKMAQADPQGQENNSNDVAPTSQKGMVVTNVTQEERERRYDMKMSQADQQHSDNKEKRGGPEDDIFGSGRMQPTSMRSPGHPDKQDDFDIMDSSVPPIGDRGVIVSDVERGQGTENELAVAIAIDEEEEEEEKFYAYAVEYDPDSKPPLYQNRRCRLYGIVGSVCFVVMVVLLSATIVVTGKNSSNGLETTLAPTMSPTTERENAYRTYFAGQVGEKIYQPGTPHYSAANWIINEDPMQLESTDSNLLQRFMMAFLYFHSTDNGKAQWVSCNPPKKGEDDTCVALDFTRLPDDSITYVPRKDATRWLSGQDECNWNGVECAGGTAILGFNLIGQNLTGTLPTELAALPLLQGISMPFNQITGTIPPEYAKIRNLIQLEVHGNMLTGSIPVEFFETDSMALQSFNVGDNILSGKIDTRIGLMTDLKGLHIFQNHFLGSFPTEVGNLRFLSFMRVYGNKFAGPLPTELGNLRQLSEFRFEQNTFSGAIPSDLGQLARLQDLRLSQNRFSGTIPNELFNMSKLTILGLDENRLTGTLSTLVGQLTSLNALLVSTNQLTGTIPSEIQSMVNLNYVYLHKNLFTGQVPTEICSLVSQTGLSVLQADCNPPENPSNPCSCCTACCDRSDGVCLKTQYAFG